MEVVLYSTNCAKCKILKTKLANNNIDYTENNDVDEMSALGIKEVPALSVDGQILTFLEANEWVNNTGDIQ